MSAIAVMTSGGDSAGMNPGVKQFVEHSLEKGLKPYLIYDGLEGMIDNRIKPAAHRDVSGIIYKGGTIIRSSRSKRFFDKQWRQRAYDNLRSHDIDKLVVFGGDGSFRALDVFYRDFGVPFIGIPATIDNDIFGTDYCLGADTALNIIRQAIDDVRDTASSFKRAFVIETMGRDCGYLALVSALTSGAEICLIPELPYDLDSLGRRFKREVQAGRTYIIAIVAEGVKFASQLTEWLEDEIGMESRLTTLGHIQRGGSPTVHDRLMGFEFATLAIDGLLEGRSGEVVCYKNSKMIYKSIAEIAGGKYQINPLHLEAGKKLTR
ncbi:MAG: 6-phosphofructokinase [Helicobacteraceae bacterium]|jgi:6-phosphofructokinase 1|nr:6-phosphofructokinase [Helicobacteraceae bacterium]